MKKLSVRAVTAVLTAACFFAGFTACIPSCPAGGSDNRAAGYEESQASKSGGGYAASGKLKDFSYTTQLYDASSGLPTSDAMFVMGARNGYVWIGGYWGVIRYDGNQFERLDTSDGLTSARGFYEDSRGRVWVATNDNGVVVIDGEAKTHYTYKDDLPSSSIRIFTEDLNGNIFIGTTAGMAYVDPDGELHRLSDARLDEERILKLDTDSAGRVYGQTANGMVFSIDDRRISAVYDSDELGMEKITTFMADPITSGKVYLCTMGGTVYYGPFGRNAADMKKISTDPVSTIQWISYDCATVWIASKSMIGYLDGTDTFRLLEDIPMDGSIEMMTSDYQGNIWMCSSTQGVMKIVTNAFIDLTDDQPFSGQVVNTVCKHGDDLYIGTDNGLKILDGDLQPIENDLTAYVGTGRVRCIKEDSAGNIWVAVFTENKGLVCKTADGKLRTYTTENGMPGNEIRCVQEAADGCILVGTNSGLAVIKDGETVRTAGSADGIKNTVFLCVEEGENDIIYAGSDGDGIYVIDGNNVSRLGRENGLTSDVVMKIKRDEARDLFWIITSNSLQYMKDGAIKEVTTFPYKNNYDLYYGAGDDIWVLASSGIYLASGREMVEDDVREYKLYTINNGLPYPITSNSHSEADESGNLYIAGRKGVIGVNTAHYLDENSGIKTAVSSLYCGDEKIIPDGNGRYTIPAVDARIRIIPSVMEYSNSNPLVRVYLEGSKDDGITVFKDELTALEYTSLAYGDYKLHIQILNSSGTEILHDDIFPILKKPKILELLAVRILIVLLLTGAAGLIVWRFMKTTVVEKQYETIKQAKDDAERANLAKTRFLANMSHEIRTPINTIMGMNEMAMREDATGVPKGYFMSMMNYSFDIRNASESLLGLVNDLLDMSKIESGKMHLVEEEYDISDMLRSIVAMIRSRSTQKQLTFDVVIDEILPKRLYGDDGKIKQVVLNLLTNAVKYTSIGGFALSVSMPERNNDVCELSFSVKDTGIGIKKEDMDKLFTAYERLDEEKNSGIQGTGLGLDISRRFAELMGGGLTVQSVYGEGSEFIFTVKQRIIDEAPVGVFREHDDTTPKGPYVPQFIAPDADILVVDDNPMNLNVMRGLLKATKVFVTTASSGEECLELIAGSKFDVVLLDHMMPGMDGVETLAKIRETDKELPVYALTANAAEGEEFYKSKGFNGYLSKPVDSVTLEKTIMRHLPESMMEKPAAQDAVEDLQEIPAELSWIYETDGISVEDGIVNSGGISNYIFALKMFYETVDENAKIINDAYEADNIRLYTIKVHALKTSARIIGAKTLSGLAESLEKAGNAGDKSFIDGNNDRLMELYFGLKDRLAGIEGDTAGDGGEPIGEEELKDAYDTLRDVIPQMDYDSVEMIVDQVCAYRLPEEDHKFFNELKRLMKAFDWDGMEELIAGHDRPKEE